MIKVAKKLDLSKNTLCIHDVIESSGNLLDRNLEARFSVLSGAIKARDQRQGQQREALSPSFALHSVVVRCESFLHDNAVGTMADRLYELIFLVNFELCTRDREEMLPWHCPC